MPGGGTSGSPAPPPAGADRPLRGGHGHAGNEGSRHAREGPQHRDHGPHRRGQDHDDRADPLLHRPHPQDGRGARGCRDDGLDGAGAGARHHDHVGCDDGVLARFPHQHHRYARARGLYGRGGAKPACARRRDRRLRRRRRRRAAVGDRVAPGRPVPRSADRLHQQDGPHRRGLLRLRAVHGRQARRPPGAGAAADRAGGALPRRRRPDRDARDHLQRRPRDEHGRSARFLPSSSSRRTSTTTS